MKVENINPDFLKAFSELCWEDKNLVIWALTQNKKVDEELLNTFLLPNFTETECNYIGDFPHLAENKDAVKNQWKQFQINSQCLDYSSEIKEGFIFKKIDREAIITLQRYLRELDGTLLCDLVYRFCYFNDIMKS
jgi:hypothetical protein